MTDNLTPHRRLGLVVDALARGDAAEAKRLYDACPDDSLRVLDAALDKATGFLVVSLLLAQKRAAAGDEGTRRDIAGILAAAAAFGREIAIPLEQLAAVNPQLGELMDSLKPLAAGASPREGHVTELLEALRGFWETWD